MDASEIRRFWEDHPVGEDFVRADDMRNFFLQYDAFRYAAEPHVLQELGRVEFDGRDVLEIGLGQGSDSQQIIRSGARYTGVDLTDESVRRVRMRCELFRLRYRGLAVMNGESLGFPDESFDIVWSHGVIHHSPRIETIVEEIHRVLRPGGQAAVMVYHRDSANYQVSIRVLRRLGMAALFVPGVERTVSWLMNEPHDRLLVHRDNLRREGIRYLKMENFVHKSTDGPLNVFSSVFDRSEAARLFHRFRDLEFCVHHLNERHFPVLRRLVPRDAKRWLGSRFGWHLYVRARK